jgi:streptogramin lyase
MASEDTGSSRRKPFDAALRRPWRTERIVAFHRAMSVVVLLALALVTTTVGAEETTREARVEATILKFGNVMGVGFDSLWMMSPGTNKFVRINLVDNSTTEIPISGAIGPFNHSGMAVGEGAIWLSDVGRAMIYKIDPWTNQVVKELPADLLGGGGRIAVGENAIAVGEGAVWAITSNNEMRRYSAESGTVEATVSLPSGSSGVIVAFGSVWVAGTGNDELYQVNPTTNRIIASIDVHRRPSALAAGTGSVWVYDEGDGFVQRIDGNSGELIASIDTDAIGKGSITVGGGFVWVSTHSVPIVQIDPLTNSVRGKFKVEIDEYSTLRFGGGSLWLSGATVRRIKPPE